MMSYIYFLLVFSARLNFRISGIGAGIGKDSRKHADLKHQHELEYLAYEEKCNHTLQEKY